MTTWNYLSVIGGEKGEGSYFLKSLLHVSSNFKTSNATTFWIYLFWKYAVNPIMAGRYGFWAYHFCSNNKLGFGMECDDENGIFFEVPIQILALEFFISPGISL